VAVPTSSDRATADTLSPASTWATAAAFSSWVKVRGARRSVRCLFCLTFCVGRLVASYFTLPPLVVGRNFWGILPSPPSE